MKFRDLEKLFDAVTEIYTEHRLDLSGSNLPNGVYFFRLTTGSDVQVQKWVMSR